MFAVAGGKISLQSDQLFAADPFQIGIPWVAVSVSCGKEGDAVLMRQALCLILQPGGERSGLTDGEMIPIDADPGADGQRAAGIAAQSLPDPPRPLQHIRPCAHQEHIVAAGIDHGHLQGPVMLKFSAEDGIDIALEKQRHLSGKRRRAGQRDKVLALHRIALCGAFIAGDKGLPQIIHIHAAHAQAGHTLRGAGQRRHAVVGGVIAHIDAGAVAQARAEAILRIDARHALACEKLSCPGLIGKDKGQLTLGGGQCEVCTGRIAADHIHILSLDFPGQTLEQGAPEADAGILLSVAQGVCPAADPAFPLAGVLMALIHPAKLLHRIAVQLLFCHLMAHPVEHRLIGGLLRRGVGQIVGAAGGIAVCQIQPHAKLLNEEVVEAGVPRLDGPDGLFRVGQQHIAVPAAAVEQVGPAEAAQLQQLVYVVLHAQLQKEGAASQGLQRIPGGHAVDKLLDAGKIGGIEQKRLLQAEALLLLHQGGEIVRFAPIQQILADARPHGGSDLAVVIQGNVGTFPGVGAGGHGAHTALPNGQQGVEPLLLRRQGGKLPAQGQQDLLIVAGGEAEGPVQRQTKAAIQGVGRQGMPRMLPVEMGEHRRQGQIAVKPRFVAGLPPVGGSGDVVGNVGDGGKGVAVLCLTKLGGVVIADAVQHGLGLSVAVDVPDKAISGLAVPPVGNTGAVDRLAHIMEQTAEGGLYGLRVHEDPCLPKGRPLAGCELFRDMHPQHKF